MMYCWDSKEVWAHFLHAVNFLLTLLGIQARSTGKLIHVVFLKHYIFIPPENTQRIGI